MWIDDSGTLRMDLVAMARARRRRDRELRKHVFSYLPDDLPIRERVRIARKICLVATRLYPREVRERGRDVIASAKKELASYNQAQQDVTTAWPTIEANWEASGLSEEFSKKLHDKGVDPAVAQSVLDTLSEAVEQVAAIPIIKVPSAEPGQQLTDEGRFDFLISDALQGEGVSLKIREEARLIAKLRVQVLPDGSGRRGDSDYFRRLENSIYQRLRNRLVR
jgi:hypothetical protein